MEISEPIFSFTSDATTITGEKEDHYRAVKGSLFSYECPFCRIPCTTTSDDLNIGVTGWQKDTFAVCNRCGWWSFVTEQDTLDSIPFHFSARAILKKFSPSSHEVPIEPLARYIGKRPDAIREMHPAKLEELVASVYSESLGYRVEFCSYGRKDRGIDLVLVRIATGEVVAVQVKRNKNPIELGQIHQFFGAIVDAGHTEGIFVSAGRFRSGAHETAQRLDQRSSIRINLVDGRRFLEFIGVYNQRQKRMTAEECPYWKVWGYWVNYR